MPDALSHPHADGPADPLRQGCVSVNYGPNRLRFLSAVPAGGQVRLRAKVLEVRDRPPERVLVTYEITSELRGSERPALVAETLCLVIPRPSAGPASG